MDITTTQLLAEVKELVYKNWMLELQLKSALADIDKYQAEALGAIEPEAVSDDDSE